MQLIVGHINDIGRFVEANMLPLIAACMFGFVFLTVLAVTQILHTRQAVRRRAIAFNPAYGPVAGGFEGGGGPRLPEAEDATELLYSVEKGLSDGDKRVSKLRRELIRAGFFRKDAVFWYYVARFGLASILALAALALVYRFAPGASAGVVAGLMLIGAAIGLLVPSLVLSRQQANLLQQCRDGFPNFLDLLVVCSEAGLTPRAGIERISRELTRTHPFLGANLFLMCLELRAGRPLAEAIDGLGRRVQIEEVRTLGTLLQQTEELGTNLTTSLRVYSEEMRAKRLLRAEERAHVLPVKLVLPLAFFVFPVMMIVTLLPIFIRIYKAFFS
jgi:tight adherence protein C